MPKLNEIFDMGDKSEPKEKPKASKKKREFTEEQKQILRDRLKIGRETAAANRAAKKEIIQQAEAEYKAESHEHKQEPKKMEAKKPEPEAKKPEQQTKSMATNVADAMNLPVNNKEVKTITKYLLELDEGDDMDPKELKQFLTKLYKASKTNVVQAAMASREPPKQEPKQEPKHEPYDFKPVSKPIYKEPAKPEVNKAEEEYKDKLAKLKATIAAKKRR